MDGREGEYSAVYSHFLTKFLEIFLNRKVFIFCMFLELLPEMLKFALF